MMTRSPLRARVRALAVGVIGVAALAFACAPLVLTPPAGPPGAPANPAPPAPVEPVTAAAPTAPDAVAPRPAPTSLRIAASDFDFDQHALRAVPGQTVTVTLDNKGTLEHNFHVAHLETEVGARPGQSASSQITFDQPGAYDFYCTLPGHKDAGMHGTIQVGDAAGAPVEHNPTEATAHSPDLLTRLPQPPVRAPITRTAPALVIVDLETLEVTAQLADGVAYRFWTFNGTVPGPMIRVRQGDTVELTLRNAPGTTLTHSINLHAVNGPGGGSVDTQVAPGHTSSIRFQALHPGVYVYHCMTPMVGQHVANGMYGMIVVEPPEGLPRVDREFYIMQGDFYLKGDRGQKGLRGFSLDRLLQEDPEYVVYNGSVGALTGQQALRARVGEVVRFFFGVGGPNKDSAFHVVGESFDRLHPDGAPETLTDVQTTLVPPGGAIMAELKLDVPGHYLVEDHHITRLEKGAMAEFEVEGDSNPEVFEHLSSS